MIKLICVLYFESIEYIDSLSFNFFHPENLKILLDMIFVRISSLRETQPGENYWENELQTSNLPMICPRKFYFQ